MMKTCFLFVLLMLIQNGLAFRTARQYYKKPGLSPLSLFMKRVGWSLSSLDKKICDAQADIDEIEDELMKPIDRIDDIELTLFGAQNSGLDGRDELASDDEIGLVTAVDKIQGKQDNEILGPGGLKGDVLALQDKQAELCDDVEELQIPLQCKEDNYNVLSTIRRHINSDRGADGDGDMLCDTTVITVTGYDADIAVYDWAGNGWYRFMGDAGIQIPTSAPAFYKCGTSAPGWLATSHPTIEYETIPATYCFRGSFVANSCQWHTEGLVTKCNDGVDDFYVYYLVDVATKFPPRNRCKLAYCGMDPA